MESKFIYNSILLHLSITQIQCLNGDKTCCEGVECPVQMTRREGQSCRDNRIIGLIYSSTFCDGEKFQSKHKTDINGNNLYNDELMLLNEEKTEIDYKPKSLFGVMNNISSQITFPSNKTSIGLIKYGLYGQFGQHGRRQIFREDNRQQITSIVGNGVIRFGIKQF